jgi:PIN domain nuclease of toxin-antitoxin system
MRLLLDTHVLLWSLAAPEELSATARERIASPENVVLASVVSAWEIEIKRALRKLEAPEDLEEQLARVRFTELPLHIRHARALSSLPPIHRDPFDRMLVAQAITDGLTLVTRDRRIARYPVATMRA